MSDDEWTTEIGDERAASEIVVPACAEDTWEAITDPERLGDWLGDGAELELRPGGELEIRVGDEHRSGFFEEIEPARRLTFWWHARGGRVLTGADRARAGGRRHPGARRRDPAAPRRSTLPGIELETRIGGGGSPQMSAAPLALVG